MMRTAFTFLILAVLSLSAAVGSPAPSAKSRSSARATATHSSKKSSHAAAGKSARASGRGSRRRFARGIGRNRRARARAASLHGMRVVPTPLAGSLESLTRQNDKTEGDGLERILDEDDLADRIARKMLVPVPASASLTVNGDLPETHRYCRPWTAVFLGDLAKIHAAMFHKPLEVSSAVRTVEYQERLRRTNGNAAAADGDVVSPHLTGATIDIAKQGLSRQEMTWMRNWLLPLQQAGKIDVEEEFKQACFHITVYKSYVPADADVDAAPAKDAPVKAVERRTRRNSAGQA